MGFCLLTINFFLLIFIPAVITIFHWEIPHPRSVFVIGKIEVCGLLLLLENSLVRNLWVAQYFGGVFVLTNCIKLNIAVYPSKVRNRAVNIALKVHMTNQFEYRAF